MGTYFDAVISKQSYSPIFNGIREETKKWIHDNPEMHEHVFIVPGETVQILTTDEYTRAYGRHNDDSN